MRARYLRYDGSQDPFGEQVDVGEVLERIGDDLLSGAGGDRALQRLLRQGLPGRVRGLDELRRRVRRAREEAAARTDPEGPFADLRDRLDAILDEERGDLAARDDDAARFAELQLDALPTNPAAAVRDLQDYGWSSPVAGAQFADLLDELRGEVLDAYFGDITRSMESVTPEDVAAMTRMLADLNALLEARARGEEPDFAGFMAEHGHLFPEQPRDLDELLDVLARRMAAMSRLLGAMSPDQRRALADLARAVLDDVDLQFQLSQLEQHLRGLLPQLAWDEPAGAGSGEAVPLSAAVDAAERLAELEELEETLAGDYAGASLEDVDEEALRRALGEDAALDLRRLRQIERALEEAGVLQRRAGQLELTPRGARLLGERALTKLLERIRRETAVRATGLDAEPTGQTRAWRFGDREPIAVQRTIGNAVLRRAAAGSPPGSRVRLRPEDFEVAEHEVRPRTATALLLDLSFSMPLRGHFVPAKRMALALHALIEGKYPQDALYLVGFSDYARRLEPADLGASGFERVYGTNMHHAFLLARRLLSRDPRPVKQVIMVTDGEPTAHLDGDRALFNWPPVRETIVRTLQEALRLSRAGIAINVFLLEDEPGLVAFADRLAHLTGGQVLQVRGDELGRTVVSGYG